jgi:protein-tyrosine phosphatase
MAKRILFVCLGNICRSPTAEGVVRAMARAEGLTLEVDSCGTGGWHAGEPPHPPAVTAARARGYDLSPLRARQVTREDFTRFDRIYAMDRANLRDLQALRPEGGAEPELFLRHAPQHGDAVPDPWYTGEYDRTLDMIEDAARGLCLGRGAEILVAFPEGIIPVALGHPGFMRAVGIAEEGGCAALVTAAQRHVGDLLDAGAQAAVGGVAVGPQAGAFDLPGRGRGGGNGKGQRGQCHAEQDGFHFSASCPRQGGAAHAPCGDRFFWGDYADSAGFFQFPKATARQFGSSGVPGARWGVSGGAGPPDGAVAGGIVAARPARRGRGVAGVAGVFGPR